MFILAAPRRWIEMLHSHPVTQRVIVFHIKSFVTIELLDNYGRGRGRGGGGVVMYRPQTTSTPLFRGIKKTHIKECTVIVHSIWPTNFMLHPIHSNVYRERSL